MFNLRVLCQRAASSGGRARGRFKCEGVPGTPEPAVKEHLRVTMCGYPHDQQICDRRPEARSPSPHASQRHSPFALSSGVAWRSPPCHRPRPRHHCHYRRRPTSPTTTLPQTSPNTPVTLSFLSLLPFLRTTAHDVPFQSEESTSSWKHRPSCPCQRCKRQNGQPGPTTSKTNANE